MSTGDTSSSSSASSRSSGTGGGQTPTNWRISIPSDTAVASDSSSGSEGDVAFQTYMAERRLFLRGYLHAMQEEFKKLHPNSYRSKVYENPEEIQTMLNAIDLDLEDPDLGFEAVDNINHALRFLERHMVAAENWPMEPVDLVDEYWQQRREQRRQVSVQGGLAKELGLFGGGSAAVKEYCGGDAQQQKQSSWISTKSDIRAVKLPVVGGGSTESRSSGSTDEDEDLDEERYDGGSTDSDMTNVRIRRLRRRVPTFVNEGYSHFFEWDAPSFVARPEGEEDAFPSTSGVINPAIVPTDSALRKIMQPNSSMEKIRQSCGIHAGLLPCVFDSAELVDREDDADLRLTPAIGARFVQMLATVPPAKQEGEGGASSSNSSNNVEGIKNGDVPLAGVEVTVDNKGAIFDESNNTQEEQTGRKNMSKQVRTVPNPDLVASRVSVLLNATCMSLTLVNPLTFVGGGMSVRCDTCGSPSVHVTYQVQDQESREEDRDASAYFAGTEGFDQCLLCAVYYFQLSQRNLTDFVSGSWDGQHDDPNSLAEDQIKLLQIAPKKADPKQKDISHEDDSSSNDSSWHTDSGDDVAGEEVAVMTTTAANPPPTTTDQAGNEDSGVTRSPLPTATTATATAADDEAEKPQELILIHSPTSFTPSLAKRGANLSPFEYYENAFCEHAAVRVKGCRFSSKMHENTGVDMLAAVATVAIAPRGSHLIAWFSGDAANNLPPPDWKKMMRISVEGIVEPARQVSMVYNTPPDSADKFDDTDGGMDRADTWHGADEGVHHGHAVGECSLCLEVLDLEEGDCVQTRCRHWFHVRCLQRWIREPSQVGKGKTHRCPLCREENPMQQEDQTKLLEQNEFRVTVRPSATARAGTLLSMPRPQFLFVGVLISSDGKYENATDIGALQRVDVQLAAH